MQTHRTHRRRGALGRALTILLLLVTAACAPPLPEQQPFGAEPARAQRDVLTFAETWEFWTAPTLLADIRNLYERVGLDVRVAKFPTGLAAKNAVLTRSTDLGLVADTPMALAGFRDENVRLIATYFRSDSIVKLAAANGGGEPTREDLMAKPVGYVPGTISEQVLERILADYALDRDKVRTASFRPNEMVDAMATGAIGSFVGWEPLPIYAKRTLGEEHVGILSSEEFYTVSLHLVTRPDVIEKKRGALLKFVRALDLARQEIAEDPEGTRREVEEALGFKAGELADFWQPNQFKLRLDVKGVVDNLEKEAEWLVRAGYATGGMPSYATLIDGSIYEEYVSEKAAWLG